MAYILPIYPYNIAFFAKSIHLFFYTFFNGVFRFKMCLFNNFDSIELPIICFHGSPGTKNDFLPLKNLLPQYNFIPVVRKGYPNYEKKHYDNLNHRSSLLIGYSWGCREMLEFYFKYRSNVKGIILISPYLMHVEKISRIKKIFIQLPIFHKNILKFYSSLEIRSFITKTSQPSLVPLSYSENKSLFAEPGIFIRSINEKIEPQTISYASIIRDIDRCNLPMHIIFGEEDSCEYSISSVSMIRKISSNSTFRCVKGSGHALPWTHPEIVAETVANLFHVIYGKTSHCSLYYGKISHCSFLSN